MEEIVTLAGKKLGYTDIREQQMEVIKGYAGGRDVMFCSPGGSGKSLTFEVAPTVMASVTGDPHCRVLLVLPLERLMALHAKKLRDFGVPAVYVRGKDDMYSRDDLPSCSSKEAARSDARVWVLSPETCLGPMRAVISENHKSIKAVFIDEAHCIIKYGVRNKKPTHEYNEHRPAYSRLGEMRTLLPNTPFVCLAGALTMAEEGKTVRLLGMKDPVLVRAPPVNDNITYTVIKGRGGKALKRNFAWLLDVLREKGQNTPRILVFFRKHKHMSNLYAILAHEFRSHGKGMFEMYHTMTQTSVKTDIIESFRQPGGLVRVVLCHTGVTMGLDLRDAQYVYHYGPSDDRACHLQETGRITRDQAVHCQAVLIHYRGSTNSKSVSSGMKEFTDTQACRRELLLQPFTEVTERKSRTPGHLCCDNCAKLCSCGACPPADPLVRSVREGMVREEHDSVDSEDNGEDIDDVEDREHGESDDTDTETEQAEYNYWKRGRSHRNRSRSRSRSRSFSDDEDDDY